MMSARLHRRARGILGVVVIAMCAVCLWCAPAWAVSEGVGWEVTSSASPTHLAPGHKGTIEVAVFNVGARSSSGPITVTDTLPPGVTATAAGREGRRLEPEEPTIASEQWICSGSTVVTCTNDLATLPALLGGGGLPPMDGLVPTIGIAVDVAPGTAEGALVNRVSVAGGGAVGVASSADPLRISSTPATFGIAGREGWFSNADGTLDTQAGSHPYAATFEVALATSLQGGELVPAGGKEARNITVSLPPGLLADPHAVPQCTTEELERVRCPGDSQVGRMAPTTLGGVFFRVPLPLFNMVPPRGVPLEFGVLFEGIPTLLDAGVRSGSDYGGTTTSSNIPVVTLEKAWVTLWGVPGDPSHNFWRSEASAEGCTEFDTRTDETQCKQPEPYPKALLTLPVACEGPQKLSVSASTWQEPVVADAASFNTHDANGLETGFGGCEALKFDPSISTALDTARADTPAGLSVDVSFPLEGFDEPEGLVPSYMKDATVTLPEGLVVNPGQANGLVACQETEASLHKLPNGEENNGPAACPDASKIGTARIASPLLEDEPEKEVVGSVYLLQSDPPDLKVLIAGSADGVNIKSVGAVHLDEATGRLTATFQNTPQLPVSDIKLTFNGGTRGVLITPRTCGAYTTNSDFTPWSTPATPDATPSAQFALGEAAGGGACQAGEPFAPAMTAGMLNNQAGAFSPLSVTLSRQDNEQDPNSLTITTPPGLLAMLKSAERCPEPQASQGTCGAGSLIGHTTVAVGAGPDPFYVQGGQVFLTGPYKGAPFGLSVVVPAVAGPFNLGNVIVRAAITINPLTAQPTIASDPLPRILDGVPLQIKTLNVTIDRAGFMFNPTSCVPMSLTGTLTSTHGATSPVSTRYQAANCANLPFKPSFKVTTQANTSKKQGASLDVKVASSTGQANIGKVAVSLPKQLPSRLSTIQQACTQATFDTNPASCPAGSNIGIATAITPVLANPLMGPAYLVSHGGAAFPDLVVILQGEGVTLKLTGSIDIKKGITSSTFASVPDAPIDSFELKLPEGPHSALAAVLPAKAKGNLCGTSLTMPTAITGQNGAQVKQNTKIAVAGCPKAKKKAKAKKRTHKARGKKTKGRKQGR